MEVILSDPIVTIKGWLPEMDMLGQYTLTSRKTPEEIRKERQAAKDLGSLKKVNLTEKIHKSVICKQGNEVMFTPGLWPRVRNWLDRRHIHYTLTDHRNPEIRPQLDIQALKGESLRDKQDVALAMISRLDCGIIETTTGWGKTHVISLLCKSLPSLNILVVTRSAQVVGTIYDYLQKTVPGQVGILKGGRDNTQGKRVIVSTFASMNKVPPDEVHLVLVDECHDVGDNQAGKDLLRFRFARKFGFSASPIRNDGSARVMESILGPVILQMSYQQATDSGMVTPIRYTMLRCSAAPPIALNPAIPEHMLKRFSYWANQYRNQAIANFVKALTSGYDGQVLIMVSTLEHAIYLNALLPWFAVACGSGADIADLRKKFQRSHLANLDLSKYRVTEKKLNIMRNAFSKGTLKHVIATKTWKAGCNFPHLACLIRADGDVSGVEGIQIPGRLARLDGGKPAAYLIDVMDSFSSWAVRRAEARRKQYNDQQWIEETDAEVINDLINSSKVSTTGGDEAIGSSQS